MNKKKLKIIIPTIGIIITGIIIFLYFYERKKEYRTTDDILINGKLKVSITPSYYDYFLHNTEIRGANFEILSEYAKYLNVELIIDNSKENADIIIENSFKKPNKDFVNIKELEKSYYYKIIEFDSSLNIEDNIFIKKINHPLIKKYYYPKKLAVCETELLEKLNKDEIKVLSENFLIEVYSNYYVRKNDIDIANSFVKWYKEFSTTKKHDDIYNKYHRDRNLYYKLNSHYFSITNSVISPYDKEIKKYCENWDWRFISALIYEESRFNPHIVNSESGAFGLMQLLPYNMDLYKFDTSFNIESQIHSGVQLLNRIDKIIPKEISDDETRKKVILSAYMVGISHVMDAIALSEKYAQKDIYKWNTLSYYLENLSNPDYYEDKIVKRGKCSCSVAVAYSNNIYIRYLNYKNLVE